MCVAGAESVCVCVCVRERMCVCWLHIVESEWVSTHMCEWICIST